jgi:hypothetical protein
VAATFSTRLSQLIDLATFSLDRRELHPIRIQAELVAASPEMQAQLCEMMRGGLRATLENLRRLLQDQAPPRTLTTLAGRSIGRSAVAVS